MDAMERFIRLGVAALGGIILGFDRELRGISAGVRTHAVVSVSAAVITVSALLLYTEIRAAGGGGEIDPLRVIQGLAQAIGFIAAGAIFVSRGDVHNLTSVANLWLAAAIGIAAGAGQFILSGLAIFFGVVLISVVRLIERFRPGSDKAERGWDHKGLLVRKKRGSSGRTIEDRRACSVKHWADKLVSNGCSRNSVWRPK